MGGGYNGRGTVASVVDGSGGIIGSGHTQGMGCENASTMFIPEIINGDNPNKQNYLYFLIYCRRFSVMVWPLILY